MNAMTGLRALKPCPTCRKPAEFAFKPFCSKRCADIDLNRWLVGAYAIPTNEAEDDEAERPSDDPQSAEK